MTDTGNFFLIPVDIQIYYNKINMILSCTDLYHDCGSIMQSEVSMSALMKFYKNISIDT
jgi:hypothetical protein